MEDIYECCRNRYLKRKKYDRNYASFRRNSEQTFEISHIPSELDNLASYLKIIEGETKIIMEYTGKYYQLIAELLIEKGFFVSIIHAKLIHDFGNNSIREVNEKEVL